MQIEDPRHRPILVTGSTGYIGGRLVPRLLEMGYRVRCLVRDPARLQGRPWQNSVEIVAGDILQPESLAPAMQGVQAAFYLVHSLGSGSDFHQRDLDAAGYFGAAARTAGIERIIFLGALAEAAPGLSEHLRSRQQTGDALRAASVPVTPVTEFRAGVIVGSGSLSFEMIRYLAERVPVMICPRWVYTHTQPIGIREVLDYLAAALAVPESTGRVIEIGGADVVTYGEMMMIYAEARGLKRWMVPVPVLTPRLSSYWVNIVTPIPAAIARPLIEGLRNESIVHDPGARHLFPGIQPVGYRTSVERALAQLQASQVETAWSDALSTSQGTVPAVLLTTHEGMIVEQRQRAVLASPAEVFKIFTGLGGKRGWFYMNWAWEIRGLMDRILGGVGVRRGRRDPDELRVGDAFDFWRVEAVEPDRLLRLRAEMKVPGKAWLQFQVTPREEGQSLLSQIAYFAPKGLLGSLYWYALYPFHGLIFSGLIDQIAERSVNMRPLHLERHRTERIGWLRAAVLGANDGILSTASLVLGVAASHASHSNVLVAGVAGLVAGAMSMAAGEYVSVHSQADTEKADIALERRELQTDDAGEHKELAAIYVARGLEPALAKQVADQLMAHDALGAHVRDELGISQALSARPIQAALASAGSFAVGAFLPLLVTALVPPASLIYVVSGTSLAFLALLGGVAAGAGGAPVAAGALRVTFWGALAMALTAGAGALFGAAG